MSGGGGGKGGPEAGVFLRLISRLLGFGGGGGGVFGSNDWERRWLFIDIVDGSR